MRKFLAISLSVMAAAAVTPSAIGATLNAGDILEIRFSTAALVCPGVCDAMVLFPNEAGFFFASDVTAKLFDGNTLLGTYFSAICCVPSFRSASSLSHPGVIVDFTSINSGTINGIIDMSIATGSLSWPSAPTPELIIGHTNPRLVVLGGTGLQVNSISVLSAPEPSTIATFLGGLVFLGFRQCRARLYPCALGSHSSPIIQKMKSWPSKAFWPASDPRSCRG